MKYVITINVTCFSFTFENGVIRKFKIICGYTCISAVLESAKRFINYFCYNSHYGLFY